MAARELTFSVRLESGSGTPRRRPSGCQGSSSNQVLAWRNWQTRRNRNPLGASPCGLISASTTSMLRSACVRCASSPTASTAAPRALDSASRRAYGEIGLRFRVASSLRQESRGSAAPRLSVFSARRSRFSLPSLPSLPSFPSVSAGLFRSVLALLGPSRRVLLPSLPSLPSYRLSRGIASSPATVSAA